MNSYTELLEYARQLPVLDTHSHIPPAQSLAPQQADLLADYLRAYVDEDLVSAGASADDIAFLRDLSVPIETRFTRIKPYWEVCRTTGYGQAVCRTLQALYGVSDFPSGQLEALNSAYLHRRSSADWYTGILKDQCGIERIISDFSLYTGIEQPHDPLLFAPVFRMDHLIYPHSGTELDRIERECGFPVNSFDDHLRATETILQKAFANGAIGLKCGLAYSRSLFFDFADQAEARRAYECVRPSRTALPDGKAHGFSIAPAFQNYMMHYILSLINKKGAVFQFHTGIQAGNGNTIANTNPMQLSNLFLEYRNVKFDLFHAGYPYYLELGALAKQFPNVYANLCWTHIISPHGARQALAHWLDSVPYCKILGFGDDYFIPDTVIGHLEIARENLCRVLADRVSDGCDTMNQAKEILTHLLYQNAKQLYQI